MGWPNKDYGIKNNPLVISPYVSDTSDNGSDPPPDNIKFLLLDGDNFFLLDGDQFDLLGS